MLAQCSAIVVFLIVAAALPEYHHQSTPSHTSKLTHFLSLLLLQNTARTREPELARPTHSFTLVYLSL